MMRTAILASFLFVLWLLLSGVYTPLIISLGAISSIFTIIIVRRMGIIDSISVSRRLSIAGLFGYLFWLLKEIARANWAVTRVILSSPLSIRQKLFDVPTSQKTDMCKVIFANSITLTPGTITVETDPGTFLIHALTENAADMAALADMDRRVSVIEKSGSTN